AAFALGAGVGGSGGGVGGGVSGPRQGPPEAVPDVCGVRRSLPSRTGAPARNEARGNAAGGGPGSKNPGQTQPHRPATVDETAGCFSGPAPAACDRAAGVLS